MTDPIRFEVVRNALMFAAEEMAVALRRSAYSTNVKTRGDFSCGLFDRDLRIVAQSFSQPAHLGLLATLVARNVRAYGIDRLGSGDGILVNDPFSSGSHLNDITLISPIYHRDALVGFVANLVHHIDVGGGAAASIGAFQEIYQEGVQIPAVKLIQGGEIVEDVFNLIMAQVRAKRETRGDFRAQIAANNTGIMRFGELLDRLGENDVLSYIDELIAYTERRARAEVAQLPQGMCEAIGYLDDDGFSDQPVKIQAKITFGEDGVHFDLTGSDTQRRAPVNATIAQTFAACTYALKCLIDPDVPLNEGFFQVVSINAPKGTVVNATHPSAVVGGWEVAVRLVETLLKAFSQLVPNAVPAGTKGMICHAGFGGNDPRTGEYYCYLETLAGGYGGRQGLDGPDAVQVHIQNTENAPIEEIESNYPVRILRYGLVEDSDGPGQWRGGLGVRRDYLFLDHDATFTVLADRVKQAPWGLFGGGPGATAHYILNPSADARELPSKGTVQLKGGDVVSYRTAGGGGYGPASTRDPELVRIDVLQEKISMERARSEYHVAIDPASGAVDPVETQRLRSQVIARKKK